MTEALESYYYYRELLTTTGEMKFPCKPDIGMVNYGYLGRKSEGVSGDILARGQIDVNGELLDVVIKYFFNPLSI